MTNHQSAEILKKAMQWCSRKEYNSKNIFEKILTQGCTNSDAEAIVEKLKELDFINDYRFTEAYINDKIRLNKWGKVKITYMLRTQGIENTIIQDILSQTDETQYISILEELLTTKYKSIQKNTPYEIRAKLFRFASGRGFESEIIQQSLDKLFQIQ